MNTLQYITDKKGKKLSVVRSMKDYKKIIEDLEELEDIRLYDGAMASKEPSLLTKLLNGLKLNEKKVNGLSAHHWAKSR